MRITMPRIAAGSPFPTMTWPLAGGGHLTLAGEKGWRLLLVYRGKHCPLCKKYLATLNAKLPEFEAADIRVGVVSADPRERAETEVKEEGWRFPVAYDMSLDQMRELGLYISDPRSPQKTDRPLEVAPLSPCSTGLTFSSAMPSARAVRRTNSTACSASSLSWTSQPTILRLYRSRMMYRWNQRPTTWAGK